MAGGERISAHTRPWWSGGARQIDVHYRTGGAFLLAYSSRLSHGEIFLESASPFALGTRAALRLCVPGVDPIEIEGTVTWTRPIAAGPGQPPGMGLALAASIEAHGSTVDRVASRYAGTRILLSIADQASRAIISRYVRSIMKCELVEVGLEPPSPAALQAGVDLAVVDLDSTGMVGETLIKTLKQGADTRELPVVALAQSERDRAQAAALGADEALANPPPFADLQAAIVHALSRPIRWADA